MHNPKAGELILWKAYGFRHIVKDENDTFCGHNYRSDWNMYKEWSARDEFWGNHIKYGKDTMGRPLCGLCRKVNESLKQPYATEG
jgi:hypothetical protein